MECAIGLTLGDTLQMLMYCYCWVLVPVPQVPKVPSEAAVMQCLQAISHQQFSKKELKFTT